MQLINNEKLSKAKVNKEFFPFFHVDNIFLDNIDTQSVIDDFPSITDGGSFHISSVPSGKLIKQLVNELERDEIKTILETQFRIHANSAWPETED